VTIDQKRMTVMDKTDLQILKLVQDNARISNSEIARQVGMVPSGVLERIRKLEENGFIEEYTARLSADALNLGLIAFVFVTSSEPPGSMDTAQKLADLVEVLEVHHVAGEDCYLLKVRLKDNHSLAVFMREKIGTIPTIVSTRSTIVLDTIKETSKIKLPVLEDGK
jgi:Lrp/AsnC family transcriptional regulator, leucine-responsive regulatory protein